MRIQPIVEGHGEVEAVPVLLRRLLSEAQVWDVDVAAPIRRTQAQFTSREAIQAAVQLARLQNDCTAIVILFDGEDVCPVEVATNVRTWAQAVAGTIPCEVVVAYREYETWLVAALESLRGHSGICAEAVAPSDPEARRDAKDVLEAFMPRDRAYSETGDQPALSAVFDLALAHRRNRSFRKLVSSVGQLLRAMGRPPPIWPPLSWQ